MVELLFLLLPVAAGYGYIMGKNSARSKAHEQNRQITSEYSKGLKFLLDREEDQGLEHLINLLEVSADSVEHYLTLAIMFRRRGEFDRAIKIHKLLLEQANLNSDTTTSILIELAQDYIMAGLLDCAEEHLLNLVERLNAKAIELLFDLYLQTKEWQKGISLYEKNGSLFSKHKLKVAVANFYCEQSILIEKPKLMRKVLGLESGVVRPLFELGKAAFLREDHVKAISYWRDLLMQTPNYTPLFLDDLEACYKNLGLCDQFETLLEQEVENGGVLIKIKYCRILVNNSRSSDAVKLLTKSLKKQPNIRGFSFLLEMITSQNQEIKIVIEQINELVQSYIATKTEFQCTQCGFSSHTLYWSCPSCKHWETIIPSRGLDGF
ncbi:lipopolysaccharide assembly protein LapB [Pseudoalteromonas denitrificans]|uniref:Lipopolysaccharide biosynthesis regulator YciM, contains six TPR domains and a predicted metal-binding C-terminal domain n=1 Tax=Pseudoalteromonas denitrificans DSM 6059 TaxID=1123010 RepID=A0A1I1PJ13_9GAMM|nr:lipopolysaccharide assembly protein LapB [Pseudoalteromonas denitrificans]SFD09686.1 Lipopolysaccharide biosynthesis regulator YciM, contains six TPR domains and a predicted metal-binding C-terminal domain [Pseudoalteromonas denitrificans DSM 6059]